ncbi:MAG: hypothetical protein ABI861_01590 [Panacibacter sp.]
MKIQVRKMGKQYDVSSTAIVVVSLLMLGFVGASVYVMVQGF